MDNSRHTKQTPLQMKRRMVETRIQNNASTIQKHNAESKNQNKVDIHIHVHQELPTFNYQQINIQQSIDLERKSIVSKQKPTGRLKLKDYLHLNNLEKKTMDRRSASSSKSITKKQIEPISSKKKAGNNVSQKQISEAQKIRNYENILKKQIQMMVVDEAQKLKQIQEYLQFEFQPTDKAKETFYYLFQIYNSLMQVEGVNQKMGELIRQYEQPRRDKRRQSGRNIPFWEKSNQNSSKNKQTIEQIIRESNRQA